MEHARLPAPALNLYAPRTPPQVDFLKWNGTAIKYGQPMHVAVIATHAQGIAAHMVMEAMLTTALPGTDRITIGKKVRATLNRAC